MCVPSGFLFCWTEVGYQNQDSSVGTTQNCNDPLDQTRILHMARQAFYYWRSSDIRIIQIEKLPLVLACCWNLKNYFKALLRMIWPLLSPAPPTLPPDTKGIVSVCVFPLCFLFILEIEL